jgi:CBS domain containing-hemolysin-like protein
VSEPLIASQFVELNEFFQRGLSDTSIHAIAIPVTFFLITTLHIVVGEQAPKSFAIRDPLATSNRIILPLYYFYKIFKPLIWFLNILSLAFLRLLGLTQNHEEHSHSEEELRMIIAESEEDGQINADEMELIQNVFDFDNRQVSEIMTANHKIFAIARDNRDDQIIKKIVQEGFSRVPIYEGGIDNII